MDSGEGHVCMGAGCTWDSSVPASQFCCELNTTLKNKVFFKNAIGTGSKKMKQKKNHERHRRKEM